MNGDLIKAHLNLYAVLQNLEDLVRLDPEMAALTKDWDISVQFSVRNGPSAFLEFKNGRCAHGRGIHPRPAIKLFFMSPGHLNAMFDGKATPIPLKGFTKLGFLRGPFTRLTDRLTHYLRPDGAKDHDPCYVKISTTLTLYTAAYAAKELADLEPTCNQIASRTPAGALQIEILPDGPCAHIVFANGSIRPGKGPSDNPMAKMIFRDVEVANALFTGKLDAFGAVAEGQVTLRGQIPMIDNANLILDRVPAYLT